MPRLRVYVMVEGKVKLKETCYLHLQFFVLQCFWRILQIGVSRGFSGRVLG